MLLNQSSSIQVNLTETGETHLDILFECCLQLTSFAFRRHPLLGVAAQPVESLSTIRILPELFAFPSLTDNRGLASCGWFATLGYIPSLCNGTLERGEATISATLESHALGTTDK